MQEHRSNFGIAWADDGRLFAIGGKTGPDTITATVEYSTFPRWTQRMERSMVAGALLHHSLSLGNVTQPHSLEGKLLW